MLSAYARDWNLRTLDKLTRIVRLSWIVRLANAATFPNLPTSMADLQTLITTCQNALVKKASRAIVDTAAFNVARQALEMLLVARGAVVSGRLFESAP